MLQDKKSLNEEQIAAIEHGDGPMLIIAGAGTGKTTVVTERINYLITSNKCKPSEILALTFTDKAAREMEERVDQALPYGYTQMWILTFHSFCDKILRAESLNIGLDPNYNLMTAAEEIQFFRKNLFKFNLKYFRPLGNPTKFISGLIQHFSRLKDEDVSPGQYLEWAKSQNSDEVIETEKFLELAEAYKVYEELKIKEGVLNFDDLIYYCLNLLRDRPNILKKYQQQFKYVLIDEFQDTNFTQNEIAILIAGEKANITACGDDDQSIYRFRGAAISNIIQFRARFPQAKIVVLTKNYRSTQEILDSSYSLIQNNNPDRLEIKEKINKKLISERKKKGNIAEFIFSERVEEEAEKVAKKIQEIKNDNEEVKFSDFAILIRANNHAEPFVRALQRAGISFQFLGPGMLFKQAEIKDLICYLKFLSDINDSVSFYRVLGMEVFDFSDRDLASLASFAKRNNISLFQACEQNEKIYLNESSRQKLKKITDMVLKHLSLIKKETAGQILYFFLEDSGLLKNILDYKTAIDERKAQNISKFFDKLKSYESTHEDASVFVVSDWIDLSMELGESPLASNSDWAGVDAVNIMTVHSAKGLEFPYVFLVNLAGQRFPTNERREQIPIPDCLIKEILPEGDYHLEEERRLFYVGLTRAREQIFLTAANYYGEGKRERKLSPFIFESLGEEAIKKVVGNNREEKETQLTLLDWAKVEEQIPQEKINQPITFLSFSQIETFNNCPLQYKFRYLQRIPSPPSSALTFGDTIHKTLLAFYQLAKNDGKPKENDLLNLLSKNWSSEGYNSKAHEEDFKKKGEEILKKFYQEVYDSKNLPVDLEQTFTLKIDPSFKIGGKIDRVDGLADKKIEIIDYKTGKKPDREKIENSLQMTVYALAACDPGIYNKKPEEVKLSLFYLEGLEKISTTRSSAQLEDAKKELITKKKEIETSNFEPKPSNMCDFCEFRLLCEAWQ